MIKRLAALPLFLVACTDPGGPSPPPPPTWGVPITGGTMTITRDGAFAVVADPDRDRILSVELATDRVVAQLALDPGAEPGRVIEDGAGRLHVALRRGGAVLTLDSAATAHVIARREPCAEPRGLAWASAGDVIHVACAGGELVTVPAAGGDAIRRQRLDRDPRDVVMSGATEMVTRFRSAEVLTLDAAGNVISQLAPPPLQRFGASGNAPQIGVAPAIAAVAWRAVPLADGRVLVAHQRQLQGQLGTTEDGYGGGCGGRADASLTTALPGELPRPVRGGTLGALPVDIAVSPRGDRVAVVVAGTRTIHVLATAQLEQDDFGDGCEATPTSDDAQPGGVFTDGLGAPTSAGYTVNGDLVIYYPELPGLIVRTDTSKHVITLPGGIGYDAGRAMFHRQTESKLACASCHPEGGDDGLVWDFVDLGRRRTQNLTGHILGRGPYHWTGDMTDLRVLMEEVFTGRMSGGELTSTELASLGPWLDRIPAPKPVVADAVAAERGRALFEAPSVGCAGCHSGALMTNNARFAVGTGDSGQVFKVPSLIGVASRAPYMHDGCAPTLMDRFGACGGGDRHGHTSNLTPAQLGDLVAYLETL